jgi:hypothetical protein
VTGIRYRHDAVAFVDRADNPASMPPAPAKLVVEVAVLGSRGASGRVFVEA